MIDLSPALLSVPPAAAPPATASQGVAAPSASFGQTLGAFLDAHDAASADPVAPPVAVERQSLADDGNALPEPATDEDAPPDASAVPAWFATTFPIVSLAIVERGGAVSSQAVTATVVAGASAPSDTVAAAGPDAKAELAPPAAPRADTSVAPSETIDEALARVVAPTTAPHSPETAARIVRESTIDVSDSATPASAPPRSDVSPQAIAVSSVAQPAAQLFAAAIATAGSWRERDTHDGRSDQSDAAVLFAAAAPLDLHERAVVHAAAETARGALDLTRDAGLQGVIDRIETLRDTADAADTRIRLIPDALGSIDVAVRHDGDRVHVRFTAEHDTTRMLIAEAQPRLTELAAARGVRIGETSVSTQTGTGGNTPQPRTAPALRRAPISVARETDTPTDHRLA